MQRIPFLVVLTLDREWQSTYKSEWQSPSERGTIPSPPPRRPGFPPTELREPGDRLSQTPPPRISAQPAAANANVKADLTNQEAEAAAEKEYQAQLQEARENGDLKTVAKLERAHQLVRNKQLQQARKAREARAFYGRQPPQSKAAGSSGNATQPPP